MTNNSTDVAITPEIWETLEKLSSAPSDYGLMRELVHNFLSVGRNDDALYYLSLLILNEPTVDDYLLSGNLLHERNELLQAERHYLQAIELDPGSELAYSRLIDYSFNQFKLIKAKFYCHKILEINPNNHKYRNLLSYIYFALGMVNTGVVTLKQLLVERKEQGELKPGDISSLIFFQAHDFYSSRPEMLDVADSFKECLYKILPPKCINFFETFAKDRFLKRQQKKLKIAFVFPFSKTSIAPFLLDLLKNRDQNAFEYYCFHTHEYGDYVAMGISKNCDKYFNLAQLDDFEAAKLIFESEIDILIDMRAHVPLNRLGIFVYKPAPIQISFYDYIEPIGLPQIDYIINNAEWASGNSPDPREMPDLLLPIFPLYFPLPQFNAGELVKDSNAPIIFASFNRFEKVNDVVIKVWAKLLNLKPDSTLLLQADIFQDTDCQDYAKELFQNHGIKPERLIFKKKQAHKDFLKAINKVDIALSPFPFPGVTTSFYTLSQGVPVIVMDVPQNKASKAAVSLLKELGLDEFIASTEDEYVSKAIYYSDRELLEKYKPIIKERLANADFTNPAKFQKHFETLLQNVWEKHKMEYLGAELKN
jgi:tetratricopeptide (TPR) repeat protein